MAYKQADLDRLDQAILGQELEVEVDGHRTKYRTMAELLQARAFVAAALRDTSAQAAGGGGTFRFNFTTGRE
jgi:hypothetical protein